jgi:hypothetical protein
MTYSSLELLTQSFKSSKCVIALPTTYDDRFFMLPSITLFAQDSDSDAKYFEEDTLV